MTVRAILEQKGHDVFTLGPNEKLSEAIRILAERRVGALVITNDDRKIIGILSERDIVRRLGKDPAGALALRIGDCMTRGVITCTRLTSIAEVMERMITMVPDATRLLDRMEAAGLIERQRSSEDRRFVTTRITRRGLELLDQLDEPVRTLHRQHLGALEPARLRELISLLAQVRDNA